MDMTHDEAVRRIARALNDRDEHPGIRRYPVVLMEMRGSMNQEPDVLGFCSGPSYMVECKVSRSDFTSDKRKGFRNADTCVGNLRSYGCPEGLIEPEELPDEMGLIYITNSGIEQIEKPERQEANYEVERSIMYSALRQEVIDGNCESMIHD